MLGWQKKLERRTGLLIFGILGVSSIGGLVQILPTFAQPELSRPSPNLSPYSALQLAGREVYIRESCGLCHSQQIRPLLAEVRRYGRPSAAGEFVYDRPFLWGSKRTGPDLARIGGKYSDEWHRLHLRNPRAVVPTSIMPAYPWLDDAKPRAKVIRQKMRVLQILGAPYSDDDLQTAADSLSGKTEMDALIAYLQYLGEAGETR